MSNLKGGTKIMSKKFREEMVEGPWTEEDMREWCHRPGRVDKQGNIVYFTEQAHKRQCDINTIIRNHDQNGLITHVSKIEAKYGDLTGLDFKRSMDMITNANQMFMELPSSIRKRFRNSVGELIKFMDDPKNRDEAIALGLIDRKWTPETDGLGEHIKDGSEHKTKAQAEPEPKTAENLSAKDK